MNCNIYFDKKIEIKEAICLMETKINELVEMYNRVNADHEVIAAKVKELEALVDYLLGAGLEAEVKKKLEEWLANGTLAGIIGDTLDKWTERISNVENDITEINSSLETIENDILIIKANGIDDSDNIQNAINLLPKGGVIRLENSKDFYISKTINIIKSRVTIDGNGSIINLKNSLSCLFNIDNEYNCIKNVTINKDKTWLGNMFHISGNKHTFEKIITQNQNWDIVFKCNKMWDSNFRDIVALNDTDNKLTATGKIFELNYCVGNDFTNINFGYADYGFHFTTTQEPTHGYKSEGITITNSRAYYCNNCIIGDFVTQLTICNNILDFCGLKGIFVTNGNMLNVSNNWVAVNTKNSPIGIGVSANFDRATITNNNIVGSTDTNGQGVSIGNGSKTFLSGNTLNDIPVGAINGNSRDNRLSNGGVVSLIKPSLSGFQVVGDGGGASILNNTFDCYFDLYAYDKSDASKFVYATGRKNVGAQRTLSTIASNVLSIGATNVTGTQVINGGTTTDIIQVVRFYPVTQ